MLIGVTQGRKKSRGDRAGKIVLKDRPNVSEDVTKRQLDVMVELFVSTA